MSNFSIMTGVVVWMFLAIPISGQTTDQKSDCFESTVQRPYLSCDIITLRSYQTVKQFVDSYWIDDQNFDNNPELDDQLFDLFVNERVNPYQQYMMPILDESLRLPSIPEE